MQSHAGEGQHLGYEGSDGAHAVGEDDGANESHTEGEDALDVGDGDDVAIAHRGEAVAFRGLRRFQRGSKFTHRLRGEPFRSRWKRRGISICRDPAAEGVAASHGGEAAPKAHSAAAS